jgi:hypothetical protein
MLLANEAVAAKIFSAFPACAMLRNHPVPHPNMLVPLQNLAALFRIPLDTRSNKVARLSPLFGTAVVFTSCSSSDSCRVTVRRLRPQRPVRVQGALPSCSHTSISSFSLPQLMSIFATRCMPQAMYALPLCVLQPSIAPNPLSDLTPCACTLHLVKLRPLSNFFTLDLRAQYTRTSHRPSAVMLTAWCTACSLPL